MKLFFDISDWMLILYSVTSSADRIGRTDEIIFVISDWMLILYSVTSSADRIGRTDEIIC